MNKSNEQALRAAILNVIQTRNRFIVGQAKHVFDGIIQPITADNNNIQMNREAADEILALFKSQATDRAVAVIEGRIDELKLRVEAVATDMSKVINNGEMFSWKWLVDEGYVSKRDQERILQLEQQRTALLSGDKTV